MTVRNAASMGAYGSTWEARGYFGQEPVRELLGSLTGRTAIICGNADGVFDEYLAAKKQVVNPVVFAVNDVGMFLHPIDHWVSLHADNLGPWKTVRWLHPMDHENVKVHAPDKRAYVDYPWAGLTPMFAVSGFFAMQLAWIMGADRIVLCGCPGEYRRRFFEPTPRADLFGYGTGQGTSDAGVRQQLEQEMQRLPDFRSAVRSMSGWTKEYFGGL